MYDHLTDAQLILLTMLRGAQVLILLMAFVLIFA